MVTYLIPAHGDTYDLHTRPDSQCATIGKESLRLRKFRKARLEHDAQPSDAAGLLTIYVPQIVQQMISDRTPRV